jgi:hypothetical protein
LHAVYVLTSIIKNCPGGNFGKTIRILYKGYNEKKTLKGSTMNMRKVYETLDSIHEPIRKANENAEKRRTDTKKILIGYSIAAASGVAAIAATVHYKSTHPSKTKK